MRKQARVAAGLVLLALAVAYLMSVVDAAAVGGALTAAGRAVLAEPLGLLAALGLYAAAFGLRAAAWCRMLPGLSGGQSWAALHVSLLGNHVLPFRLGEVLRVTSVLRRTALPRSDVIASAVTLRTADLLAVLGLAAVGAPALIGALWPVALLLGAVAAAAAWWVRRLRATGSAVRLPGPGIAAAATVAWLLEAAVMWAAADAVGVALSYPQAVVVTAATIAAQTLAVTPGGIGSYEAAATAALVAFGAAAGPALAVGIVAHALKTAYALVVGGVALAAPDPSYAGPLRLPRRLPPRPGRGPVDDDAPVVVMLPAYDEEPRVGRVVARVPPTVAGRPVVTVLVDDGSTDGTAVEARRAGAVVVSMGRNAGLGAAVRQGLAVAVGYRPACVVYLDADGEYPPEQVPDLAAPVLAGVADYVVGSRFAGRIDRMLAHRRLGNLLLTRWVRWMTRRPDLTDGQSGMRAFSPEAAAAAVIRHDYNYAQVLTLNLLGQGFRYGEVPIRYAFRTSGRSFVRLGTYVRAVWPAVRAELRTPTTSRNRGAVRHGEHGRRPGP